MSIRPRQSTPFQWLRHAIERPARSVPADSVATGRANDAPSEVEPSSARAFLWVRRAISERPAALDGATAAPPSTDAARANEAMRRMPVAMAVSGTGACSPVDRVTRAISPSAESAATDDCDAVTRVDPRALAWLSPESLQPPSADYASGDVIADKYLLTTRIRDGAASAWLARNLTLDVDVAIELPQRESPTDDACDHVLRQANAVARIDHRSILRVLDMGKTEKGDPFVVTEVLDGESMASLLQREGHLREGTAVQTVLPVASALAEAHWHGIVHRNLSPANVHLVTDEIGVLVPTVSGFVSTTDPVAAWRRDARGGGHANVGLSYAAPEQVRGDRHEDGRIDVWALAVLLYEAISGVRPFQGTSLSQLGKAILERTPKPLTGRGCPDKALWRIIERGLAKDRNQRWESMRSFGSALARWAVDRGIENDIRETSITTQWLTVPGLATSRDGASIPIVGTRAGDEVHWQSRPLVDLGESWKSDTVLRTGTGGILDPESLAPASMDRTRSAILQIPKRRPIRGWVIAAAALMVGGGLAVFASGPTRRAPAAEFLAQSGKQKDASRAAPVQAAETRPSAAVVSPIPALPPTISAPVAAPSAGASARSGPPRFPRASVPE